MKNLIQRWRMRLWQEVDAAEYTKAYKQFGGSVVSHPEVVKGASAIVGLPVSYYGFYQEEALIAAVPVWSKWIAGSKKALRKLSKKGIIDLGNAEFILPMSADAKLVLPVGVEGLSCVHVKNITNLKTKSSEICLAKPLAAGGLSKKFRYNRNRELRLLEEKGAKVKAISTYDNDRVVRVYTRLFEKRWGFKPTGHERMSELLSYLRPFLFGSIIEIESEPVAIQLLYKVECSDHLSIEYVNGGVDPAYNAMSVGSVLTFINTRDAWALSESKKKALRYSFGKADNEYKDRWCNRSTVYTV